MDYYSILGVSKDATPEQIKKAYRKLAMANHPDRTGGDDTKFKQVTEAYETLGDTNKRGMYDHQQNNGGQAFNFNTSNMNNFEDIFTQFGFGARQQMRNRDITIGCNVDIQDVYNGKNIIASYRLNNGREQTIDINIPIGVRNGDKIRYQNMGQQDIPQAPPGDLYVQINIKDDNNFEVHGLDLITVKRINVLSLILGTSVTVNIPNGSNIDLKIPAGTQPNTTLRITGKGLPNMKGKPGNILVKILGQIPTGLDRDDLKQIEYICKKYS